MPLSEAAPRVVLMCGISGSGKTHHALRLVSQGYVRLSPDRLVWDCCGASFRSLPAEEVKALFARAMTETMESLTALIDAGERVVVDATLCKRAVRDRLRALCRSRGVNPAVVYMDTPLATLRRRLTGRGDSGPDDLVVTPQNLDMYYRGFERPGADETDVTVISSE